MAAIGSVYVLFNEAAPGYVKVGLSADVARRVDELNAGAGVIGRWVLYGHAVVSDMRSVEAAAHERLQEHNLQQSVGREIFSCSVELAAQVVLECALVDGVKLYDDCFPERGAFINGSDITAVLYVRRARLVNGGNEQITLSTGRVVDVPIPAGTRDGTMLRLPGYGRPGLGGGRPGDAIVVVWLKVNSDGSYVEPDIACSA